MRRQWNGRIPDEFDDGVALDYIMEELYMEIHQGGVDKYSNRE